MPTAKWIPKCLRFINTYKLHVCVCDSADYQPHQFLFFTHEGGRGESNTKIPICAVDGVDTAQNGYQPRIDYSFRPMKLVLWLSTEHITAINRLIDSRFLDVWYMTDSVDSTGKTNGITLKLKSSSNFYSMNSTFWVHLYCPFHVAVIKWTQAYPPSTLRTGRRKCNLY